MAVFSKKSLYAEVVKLVDTQVSGTCGGNSVEVQVLSSAPNITLPHTVEGLLFKY